MTTAGRPTWSSAKGGRGKWEGDLSALSKQYSVRDLPAHTKLKYRQEGQGRPEELQGKDFRRDLEEKERIAALEKIKKGGYTGSQSAAISGDKRAAIEPARPETTAPSKRQRGDISTVSTANLDADDPWEEDYTEEAAEEEEDDKKTDLDGIDDDEVVDDNDNDSDDEDEEALLAELAKIKRERAEESANAAASKKANEETIRMENILKGNPLLNAANSSTTDFKIKRRWDDDVVFKNCARGEVDHSKRGFINDTLRSEFHKKFMRKYIQ